jgi:predicted glycosyltransferase
LQEDGKQKNILVAPLDWGLGHATRCIPLIRFLHAAGQNVVIGCSGRSLELLKQEFPTLTAVHIPSYNIYYQASGSFILKIIVQLNKVFRGIRREHRLTKKIIKDQQIDLIISDNRYGVYDKRINSILISHQMMVKIPGFRWIEWIVYLWLRWQHRRFGEIWIPDAEGVINLSGDLSHKYSAGKRARFIGVLTRFDPPGQLPAVTVDVLVILSGPEPQRTLFESMIIAQAKTLPYSFVIVRGVSEQVYDEMIAPGIRLISYLTANELYKLILSSAVIISRGGYSTLMDLALLGRKCIFIPTPGQTEQEYIVAALAKKNLVVSASQDNFQLAELLEKTARVNPFFIPVEHREFERHVSLALSKLQ